MNNNKIERAAIRSVEEYIDKCPRLEPFISSNDKTPIWDGDIFIYDNISVPLKLGRLNINQKAPV
jgi:hypothetical protein